MRNKKYVKALAFILTFGLLTGSVQTSVYAAGLHNEPEEMAEISDIVTESEESTEQSSSEENVEEETEQFSEEESEEQSVEETSEEADEKATEEAVEETAEEADEKATEEAVEETAEEADEKATEEAVEETAEEAETEVIQETTEESAEEAEKLFVVSDGATTSEDDFTWEGTTIVAYNGTDTEVVIPEKAQKIGRAAFENNTTIESVTISRNITDIGTYAFSGCSNLKTVKIETVKLGRTDGCGLFIFQRCSLNKVELAEEMTYIPANLFYNAGFESGTEVVIPGEVTEIGDSAFNGASNIGSIAFAGNKVTTIGSGGLAGVGIESITLPESLQSIGRSGFENCKNLKEIVLPKNVTSVGTYAFAGCSNLKTVKIDTTKIGRTDGCGLFIFQNCSLNKVELAEEMTYIPANLFYNAGFESGTEVVIPEEVTEIGDSAFNGAGNIGSIVFAGNKVTTIGSGSLAGVGIESITLPESLQSIGRSGFENCKKLKEIVLPKNVTSVGTYAFAGCSNLKTVKIETVKLGRTDGCGLFIFQNCSLNKVELAEELTYIPANLFYNAGFESGTEVVIPEEVTEIGDSAFNGAGNIGSIIFAGNKVTTIGSGGLAGVGIETITLPESLQSIGRSGFENCKKLKEIVLPKNVTSVGTYAFAGCSNLKTVKIETVKLGRTDGCGLFIFQNCSLNKVELAEKMTYIPAKLFYNAGFESGTEVVIPEEVTEIGDSAFNGAGNIGSIVFTGNKVTTIGSGGLAGVGIETITLPESLQSIGRSGFQNCKNLREITIPGKVKSIESYTFEGCDNLTKAVLPASVKSIGFSAFPKKDYLKIYTVKNSYAYKWAKENGYTLAECYTITYKLSGGVNGTGNPTAYEKGESLSFADPSRKGYTFAGWYKDSAFKKAFTYTTTTTGNLTLYAKWKIITYNITYETNGGTLAKKSPETYTVAKNVTLKNPTKIGYTFTGWYTDAECTDMNKIKKIAKGTTGDITLYAGWKENVYTIKFAANGSKVTGTQSTVTNCGYDDKITLEKCAYTRNGYEFAGWNTKANGTGTSYGDGATVEKLSAKNKGTVTLYAIWKATSYNITYHLDGGTNSSKNPENYTAVKSVKFVAPQKTGYTFKGWYRDESFTQKVTSIKKGSQGDIEVYAKWQVNKYKVKFSANKGKGKMSTLTGCEYDKSYILPANQFTRNGYTFKGWNTKANGTGTTFENEAEIINLISKNNKTVTLYAQWEKN